MNKNLKAKLKKIVQNITYKKIYATIFIFLIFFISVATLPLVFEEVGKIFQNKKTTLINKMGATIKKIDKTYEGMLDFNSNIINNKGTYINLNGLMARVMGQRKMKDVVLLNNGNLARLTYYKLNTDMQIEQLTKLYNKQIKKNKTFLFVLAPSQVSKYEDLIPEGLKKEDYTNYNGDTLLKGLKENGVPYIDIREELYKEGITHEEAFFKTDHHWKIETGFFAYTKIMDRLLKEKAISNVDKEFLDLKNYNIEIKKNLFLGSSGKRVGKYFAGLDDFPVITPKKEFQFYVELIDEKINKQGTFEEVLCNSNQLTENFFVVNPYGYYNVSDSQRNVFNSKALEKKKVLFIGDSFSNVPMPFLSLNFETVHKRDMRHFTENFESYYKEFDPDIVIVLIGEKFIKAGINKGFFENENST